MDKTVDNASEGEHTTNNSTHADQELQKVLPHVRVLNGKWRHFVVEDYQALIWLEFSLTWCSQLEDLVFVQKFIAEDRGEPRCKLSQKYRWHRLQVEPTPHISLILRKITVEAIQGVHDAGVWELTGNNIEVGQRAEWQVVDSEGVVKLVPLSR